MKILQGDCRASLLHLPDRSVQLCMSSPPYWALRSYLPKDHPLKHLEIGSEPTPALFIKNLMAVYDQVRRVLRDDGVCVVNLGDTYSSTSRIGCLEAGNAVGIPFMFAFAMQARGWIWRDTVIWRKPSAMPASLNGWTWTRCKVKVNGHQRDVGYSNATEGRPQSDSRHTGPYEGAKHEDCPGCAKCSPNDGYVLSKGSLRTTTAHEYLFIFAKGMGYYADRDGWATKAKTGANGSRFDTGKTGETQGERVQQGERIDGATANLRSVIDVSAQPMKHAHHAAYPEELCIPFIEAFTSERGCCPACGSPWARVVETTRTHESGSGKSGNAANGKNGTLQGGGATKDVRNGPCVENQTLGWRATCDCPAHEPVPCTVLDPFGGSGRTAIAAQMLGRDAICCELNEAYIDIAEKQFAETAPLLMGVI